MSDQSTERLLANREKLYNRIESIKETAVASDRDLYDEELVLVREAQDEIANVDTQLEVLTRDVSMSDEARNRIARVSRSVKPAPHYRSSGEVVYDLIHQSDEQSQLRYRSALTRAAEHMGTLAEDTTPVAGDLAGLTIDPVVGPIMRPRPQSMPFATAIGLTEVPAGTFERPYISDPDYADGVGVQTLQKEELASKAFTVDSDTLKVTTFGGYLNISRQLERYTPGALQIIVDQLRWRLGRKLEAAMIGELGNSTGTIDLAADATGPEIMAAIYEASAAVFAATGELATWVAMGPQGWARLGTAVDLAGRPLLPTVGPNNAAGSMSASSFNMTGPAGLSTIVTADITDDGYWVGNSYGIEGYAYYYPTLEAVEPSVLGRQIAVAADFVAHRPSPTANSAVHVTPGV